jgi:hypothetical protein
MPEISAGEEGAGEFVCAAGAGLCAAARFAWDPIVKATARAAHTAKEDNVFQPDRMLRLSTFVFIAKIPFLLPPEQNPRTPTDDFPVSRRIQR